MLGFGTDDGIAEGSGRHYDAAALVIGQIDGPAMLHGIGDGGVHGFGALLGAEGDGACHVLNAQFDIHDAPCE